MHTPPNPFPNGTGFSSVGFAILMLFASACGAFIIVAIRYLGTMIP
jgi:hypothetical protein